jgi:hypothetical protein
VSLDVASLVVGMVALLVEGRLRPTLEVVEEGVLDLGLGGLEGGMMGEKDECAFGAGKERCWRLVVCEWK